MEIPSERYWKNVKTIDDYVKFIRTGMAWEFEPNCPGSWEQHLELLEIVKKKKKKKKR